MASGAFLVAASGQILMAADTAARQPAAGRGGRSGLARSQQPEVCPGLIS